MTIEGGGSQIYRGAVREMREYKGGVEGEESLEESVDGSCNKLNL